ncbi:MAG: hypothetical protein AB7G35_08025 [Hyphomicrobiaceae bacterium]
MTVPKEVYDALLTENRRLAKENAWLKHRVKDLDVACMNANRRRAADQQRAAQMAAREQRLREVFG